MYEIKRTISKSRKKIKKVIGRPLNKRLRLNEWGKEVFIEYEEWKKKLFTNSSLSLFWMQNTFKIWSYRTVVRCESSSFRHFSTPTQVLSKVGFVSKTKSCLLFVTNTYISVYFHIGHNVTPQRTNELFRKFTLKMYNIWSRYSMNICSILLL